MSTQFQKIYLTYQPPTLIPHQIYPAMLYTVPHDTNYIFDEFCIYIEKFDKCDLPSKNQPS